LFSAFWPVDRFALHRSSFIIHRSPMAKLSVNLNKVATLRNTRPIGIPSIIHCARICLNAGAHGITVHPRPDQRHIRPGDVHDLASLLRDEFPAAEFNIEGNPFHEYMDLVRSVRPTQATLVPDDPNQSTSDHGWNLPQSADALRPMIRALHDVGCRVSLFVDASAAQDYVIAKQIGADRVELYTEPYAADFAAGNAAAAAPYASAAESAVANLLGVNAGHDLNLQNLPTFIADVPRVAEVSIGHALISDALEFGLAETVRRYLRAAG
jgi:pyridoxine 5-phosphate synthase